MKAANPIILSIETSEHIGSMAIHKSGQIIGTIEHHIKGLHDQVLATMLKSLIKICNITLDDIKAIAIGKGPGSYTGMRIASSFVKGLCYSKNIPLIAINSLETLLQKRLNYPEKNGLWCALIDARHKRAYALLQDQSKNSLLQQPIVKVETATFSSWLNNQPITFVGSGADAYADILTKNQHSYIIKGHYPKAHDMGKMAYHAFLAERWEQLASFSPIYIGAGVHTQPITSTQ